MNRKHSAAALVSALSLMLVGAAQLFGQDVAIGISSREAWVGSPIVLQIRITNAIKYKLPQTFEIDGCDVRSAGSPSQSSQITIINGRRSESRSITQQYLITPRRAGTFQVPELDINVAGEVRKTQPIPFVATKSETGDLLFVEIEGDKEKVYVGEPLKLKLKLWIKPFADRERQMKLKEGQMWQMISQQTSWGTFTERLEELAENGQRPGGKTVLRKDSDGRQREYYLYEIDATVYPDRPGKIDASDLQIVVNYPQALGRSRDPFESFFGGGPLGGRSRIQDMMGDDFFASPFGRRLTVSKARPIVAEVSVDSTEVVAVPTANRPSDYRGAVGKYQIIAEAETTKVSAGDPIALRIGVVGDGPMELVQAPPLHEIENLTSDFQVSDQSLAGFVQDETKVFLTSIRPRNENVKQIPPIPFSFFNPTTESYETAYTKPISIDVEKAEALDMNSIVSDIAGGGSDNTNDALEGRSTAARALLKLNLQNDYSLSLASSSDPKSFRGWWCSALVPPLCWLVIAIAKILPPMLGRLQSLKSKTVRKINAAHEGVEVAEALRAFIADRSNSDCPTLQHAAGKLRACNAYGLAAEFELLVVKLCETKHGIEHADSEDTLQDLRCESLIMLDTIDSVFDTTRQLPSAKSDPSTRNRLNRSATTSIAIFVFLGFASCGWAAEALTYETLQAILKEANSTYQAAEKIVQSQPAEAKQMFETAAQRYNLLVEQGVRNDSLFLNLGNAWYQCDETAKAILNYHRALWINGDNSIARQNLNVIEQTRAEDGELKSGDANDFKMSLGYFNHPQKLIADVVSFVGHQTIRIGFAVSSVLFWVLVTIKTLRPRTKALSWCIIPLALAFGTGVCCYQISQSENDLAVFVSNEITLKSGDGGEFQTEAKVESASGIVVQLLGQRADWAKVRLPDDRIGWVPKSTVEKVAL